MTSKSSVADRLLTTRELQSYLHLDRITIYRLLQAGDIPAMKVGGQWRFSPSEIEHWLTRQQVKAPAASATAAASSGTLSSSQALASALRPPSEQRLCDLVAVSCMSIMQNSLADALRVAVAVTDLTGTPLVPMSASCSFCLYGWTSPQFWSRCQTSWTALPLDSASEPEVHRCHAGLSYAVAPILLQKQRLGLVVAGQLISSAPDATLRRRAAETAQECGLDPDVLLSKVSSIERASPERMRLLTRMLSTVAVAMSEIASQNYQVRQKLAQVARILGGG